VNGHLTTAHKTNTKKPFPGTVAYPDFHYGRNVHKSPARDPIPNQMHPVHIFKPYFH